MIYNSFGSNCADMPRKSRFCNFSAQLSQGIFRLKRVGDRDVEQPVSEGFASEQPPSDTIYSKPFAFNHFDFVQRAILLRSPPNHGKTRAARRISPVASLTQSCPRRYFQTALPLCPASGIPDRKPVRPHNRINPRYQTARPACKHLLCPEVACKSSEISHHLPAELFSLYKTAVS